MNAYDWMASVIATGVVMTLFVWTAGVKRVNARKPRGA